MTAKKEFPLSPEAFRPENVAGLGTLALRIYYRLLLLASCRKTVAFERRWLAQEVLPEKNQPKQKNLAGAIADLVELGYLMPIERNGQGREVYEIRRRWRGDSCGEDTPVEQGGTPPLSRGKSTPHERGSVPPLGGGISPVERGSIEEREENLEEIPPTPQGVLVAPGASPLAPDDEPYSHSCAAPTWVVKRWITWANPGVEAATYEVQRLFRVLPRLAVSWNSYPDVTLWRWMFERWEPGRTKGVNVGVADLCAYLGRAQQERSSSYAPRKRKPDACAKPYCDWTGRHLYEGQRWCNGCIHDKAKALGKTAEELVPTFERDRYGLRSEEVRNRAQEAVSHLRNGHAPVGSRA